MNVLISNGLGSCCYRLSMAILGVGMSMTGCLPSADVALLLSHLPQHHHMSVVSHRPHAAHYSPVSVQATCNPCHNDRTWADLLSHGGAVLPCSLVARAHPQPRKKCPGANAMATRRFVTSTRRRLSSSLRRSTATLVPGTPPPLVVNEYAKVYYSAKFCK